MRKKHDKCESNDAPGANQPSFSPPDAWGTKSELKRLARREIDRIVQSHRQASIQPDKNSVDPLPDYPTPQEFDEALEATAHNLPAKWVQEACGWIIQKRQVVPDWNEMTLEQQQGAVEAGRQLKSSIRIPRIKRVDQKGFKKVYSQALPFWQAVKAFWKGIKGESASKQLLQLKKKFTPQMKILTKAPSKLPAALIVHIRSYGVDPSNPLSWIDKLHPRELALVETMIRTDQMFNSFPSAIRYL
jgi:hypothetical protein